VLTDFRYCGKYLDTELYEIAEAEKINLRIDSAFFSNSVIVSIYNASTRDIHNVTLLLCVRFTDMFKGDYISFPVGETLSILKSGEEVTVGRENITGITKEKLGEVKEFKDIIDFAAVLISDEVITWVDSKPAKHIDELPASAKTATLAREIAGLAASLSETKELTDDEKRKNKEIAGGIIKLLLSSVGSGQMNKADKEKITAEAKKLTENLTGKAIDFITKGISANGEFDAKQKSSIKKIKELVKSLIREAVRGIPKNQNTEKKSK
jgi:hypothetical protein